MYNFYDDLVEIQRSWIREWLEATIYGCEQALDALEDHPGADLVNFDA